MKKQNTMLTASALDAIQARFGLRVAARLNESAREVPHDVSERLKAARELALERARLARRTDTAAAVHGLGATLALGDGPRGGWWLKLASALPLIALVAGFVFIERLHTKSQIDTAAEIDAALLADDVPPDAYSDPGFVEFLKTPRD
jgi:hypothetical protein